MRILRALAREPLDRPPVWFMRQAGRYLPEYRKLRERYSFDQAMRKPSVAAEISLQPLRRFPLDGAIIFSDIMTPLAAMGVGVEFDPGPKLQPISLRDIARLGDLDPAAVDFVAETISAVRASVSREVTTIGFAGGPATLLAYLVEGGGSKHFPNFRRAMHLDDATAALEVLARATNSYLGAQVEAGAQVVQLFDSWAGLLSSDQFVRLAVPAARLALTGLTVPTIYFAPGASHLLDSFHLVEAAGYGVDWRLSLSESWRRVGETRVIQGNLDPALLLCDPDTVRAGTIRLLEEAGGRPGHIFNLGHGIFPATPVENVAAMVDAVITSGVPTEVGVGSKRLTVE